MVGCEEWKNYHSYTFSNLFADVHGSSSKTSSGGRQHHYRRLLLCASSSKSKPSKSSQRISSLECFSSVTFFFLELVLALIHFLTSFSASILFPFFTLRLRMKYLFCFSWRTLLYNTLTLFLETSSPRSSFS